MSGSSDRNSANNVIHQKLGSLILRVAEAIKTATPFQPYTGDFIAYLQVLEKELQSFQLTGVPPVRNTSSVSSSSQKDLTVTGKFEIRSNQFYIDGSPIREFLSDFCRTYIDTETDLNTSVTEAQVRNTLKSLLTKDE